MLNTFINQLSPFQAIALSLWNAPQQWAAKTNLLIANPNRKQFVFWLGFLRFGQMDQLSSHFRSRCSPLAFLPSDDGRFRIFFAGRYMGGLWSKNEIARVESAQPQSESELIQILDCVAAESGLERSPPL